MHIPTHYHQNYLAYNDNIYISLVQFVLSNCCLLYLIKKFIKKYLKIEIEIKIKREMYLLLHFLYTYY